MWRKTRTGSDPAKIDYDALRQAMVDRQIEARGIRSTVVLDAMRKVPRERFVPADMQAMAYDDSPLPIGEGQTISQPYIVAYMIEALGLRGGEKVLEVGTGSGYASAVLAEIAGKVYTIERIRALADRSARLLEELDYGNVVIRHDDGATGWPDEAPFDGIVVAAGAPDVPETLKQQLAVGGRLVIPVGGCLNFQELLRVTRTSKDEFETEDLTSVRFVPLVSQAAWPEHLQPGEGTDHESTGLSGGDQGDR